MTENNETPNAPVPAGERSQNPRLLPDGTHLYFVVDASIPAHRVNGTGTGEIRWHPQNGLQLQVEGATDEEFSDLGVALAHLLRPSAPSRGAGAVMEPSREPQLTARLAGSNETIQVYQLAVNVQQQSQPGASGVSIKAVVSGDGTGSDRSNRA